MAVIWNRSGKNASFELYIKSMFFVFFFFFFLLYKLLTHAVFFKVSYSSNKSLSILMSCVYFETVLNDFCILVSSDAKYFPLLCKAS